MEPEARLVPLRSKGHTSVARVEDAFYAACFSSELRQGPLGATILGVPLVLFRGADGVPAAVLDRCPHRNVPLSLGRVREGKLECAYHGWQFEPGGACVAVPGLVGDSEARGRRVESFACRERDGLVWVYLHGDATPAVEPFHFEWADKKGYTTVRKRLRAAASLHAVAENALDVPHTAFLHGGLFRKDTAERNEIEVVVTRHADRVEAEYKGEPRPTGLFGRLLAPGGGVVTHFDRFFVPGIVQVEYALGESHFIASAALTPISDFETELFAVISFKLPLPGWLIAPFLEPIALRIFSQDARVLAHQTESIRRFGGEQYMSTDVDVLGNHILRLLRDAERGDAGTRDREPVEKRFVMRV